MVMPWWGWLIAIGGSLIALYYFIILVLVVTQWRKIGKKW